MLMLCSHLIHWLMYKLTSLTMSTDHTNHHTDLSLITTMEGMLYLMSKLHHHLSTPHLWTQEWSNLFVMLNL